MECVDMHNDAFYLLCKQHAEQVYEKINKMREEAKCAWWNLLPEERMRKALESIALMAVCNEHLDNDHILQICRKALTGVNTAKHGDMK